MELPGCLALLPAVKHRYREIPVFSFAPSLQYLKSHSTSGDPWSAVVDTPGSDWSVENQREPGTIGSSGGAGMDGNCYCKCFGIGYDIPVHWTGAGSLRAYHNTARTMLEIMDNRYRPPSPKSASCQVCSLVLCCLFFHLSVWRWALSSIRPGLGEQGGGGRRGRGEEGKWRKKTFAHMFQ